MPGPPLGAVIVLGTMPAISSICGCSSPAGRLWIQGTMYAGICGFIGSLSNPGLMDWSVCVVPGKNDAVSGLLEPCCPARFRPDIGGSKLAITHESVAVRRTARSPDRRCSSGSGPPARAASRRGRCRRGRCRRRSAGPRCCRRPGRRRRSCSGCATIRSSHGVAGSSNIAKLRGSTSTASWAAPSPTSSARIRPTTVLDEPEGSGAGSRSPAAGHHVGRESVWDPERRGGVGYSNSASFFSRPWEMLMLWSVCSGPRWQSMHLALRVKGLEPTRIVCPTVFVISGFLFRPDSGSTRLTRGERRRQVGAGEEVEPEQLIRAESVVPRRRRIVRDQGDVAPAVPFNSPSSIRSRISVGNRTAWSPGSPTPSPA